jgi:adenylate cyclase
MREIERKYRIPALPARNLLGRGEPIRQGYLLTEQGELRVRRKGDKCYLTVKGEGTLSRSEWETEIPAWVFNTLWRKTQGKRVEKIRYSVRHQNRLFEIDNYRGQLKGLFTVECELPEGQAGTVLLLPEWAVNAVDVTEDGRYKNKALAVYGLPSGGS